MNKKGSPAKACGNRNTIKLQVVRFNKQKEFLAIRGSGARKMSLWKHWDCRQAEEVKIEG